MLSCSHPHIDITLTSCAFQSMTLKEASREALKILKQVMEEKLDSTNVEVRGWTQYAKLYSTVCRLLVIHAVAKPHIITDIQLSTAKICSTTRSYIIQLLDYIVCLCTAV